MVLWDVLIARVINLSVFLVLLYEIGRIPGPKKLGQSRGWIPKAQTGVNIKGGFLTYRRITFSPEFYLVFPKLYDDLILMRAFHYRRDRWRWRRAVRGVNGR